MAYKFQADEPLRDGIVRCAWEQLDRAIAELTQGIKEDPAKAVHNARKAIKQERSLLRLARGTMSSAQRRDENDALRSAARQLSSTRDAEVMVASIDALAERFAGQLPATTFEAIGEQLKSHRVSTDGTPNGLVADTAEELRAVRRRAGDWELDADGWSAIGSGLLRAYKRGQKAFARAKASRSSEDLHAWRKRVKDLWYHERLLAPTCGPTVGGQAKDAHRLADLLGDDHDLALLRQELAGCLMLVPVDVDAVIRLLEHRRGELQDEALQLGRRVYSEAPKAFVARMKRLWTAGRALAEEPLEHQPEPVAAAAREPRAGAEPRSRSSRGDRRSGRRSRQPERRRVTSSSKSRAAAISNSRGSSSRGGKSSASNQRRRNRGSGSGGNRAQKAAAGRKGGRKSS